MNDHAKTREQLLAELEALRRRLAVREQAESESRQLDLSERQRTEQALRDSEALYYSLVENLPVSLFRKDRDGRYTFGNRRFAQMLGRPLGEVLGRTDFDFSPPELAAKYTRDDQTVMATQRVFEEVEEYRHPDGARGFIQIWKTPVSNARGEVIGTQGIFWDITAHKQAAEALRASEERYRLLFERNHAGVILTTLDGKVRDCNAAFAAILRYGSREEVLAVSAWDFYVHRREREELLARLRERQALTNYEVRLRACDGSLVWTLGNLSLLHDDPAEPTIQSVFLDITERKRLEEQFRQAQKMEAVGRLAGGVAHDFNNMLTLILGYSDLLLQTLEPANPIYANLAEIKKAGERAAALTRQLLAFSRKQVVAPRVLDVNAIVANMDKMLRHLIGEDIELVTLLRPEAGPVRVDPGQLEQVLMNLAVNARDAMPQGGQLIIETANVTLDALEARRHLDAKPGTFLELTVRDTGAGMSPEVLAHLFEPFFTTKETGKGTGLGLSTIYGIVKQGGGHIDVTSAPGRGTTFRIYLPRVEESPVREPAEGPAPGPDRTAKTILLVEDEEMVRGLIRTILGQQGYQVLAAGNAVQALQVCRGHDGPIHLLVTDVVMPHLSGRQLAERLAPIYPEMKVLYLSGHTEDAIVRHGVSEAEIPFLQKPFPSEDLIRKVQELLAAQAAPR